MHCYISTYVYNYFVVKIFIRRRIVSALAYLPIQIEITDVIDYPILYCIFRWTDRRPTCNADVISKYNKGGTNVTVEYFLKLQRKAETY